MWVISYLLWELLAIFSYIYASQSHYQWDQNFLLQQNWSQIRDKKWNWYFWFLSIRALSLNWNLNPGMLSAERMDMSSYQFVNTLAQCYEANAQLQGGSAPPPQDYYSMQYPNCYSPATQVSPQHWRDTTYLLTDDNVWLQGYAGQYSSMMGGAAPHPGGGGGGGEQQYPPPPASSSTSASATRPR